MEHDKLQLIESRTELLLQELKEDNRPFIYATALFILVVLYLLAIVFLYIKSGFSTLLLIYLIMLLLMLGIYKISMNRAYDENIALDGYKNINRHDKVNYVAGMLRYLVSALEVKITRVQSVRLIYTVLFPLFLLILREIFVGALNWELTLIHLPVAVLIGLFWFIYYSRDLKFLRKDKEDTENLIQRVYS